MRGAAFQHFVELVDRDVRSLAGVADLALGRSWDVDGAEWHHGAFRARLRPGAAGPVVHLLEPGRVDTVEVEEAVLCAAIVVSHLADVTPAETCAAGPSPAPPLVTV